MSDLVSIIVPVYKVEEFLLRRCIESLTAQSHGNIEIILIDDGSPDNSGNICDEYAAADNRIKVIHTENGGVSSARNKGLDISSGDFITFVDSDDYVTKDYVKNLYETLIKNSADCSICSLNTFSDISGAPESAVRYETKLFDLAEALDNMFYMKHIFDGADINAVAGTLYKRELIQGLRFNENVKIGEDFVFKFSAFVRASFICVHSLQDYCYYIHQNSAMRNGFDEKKINAIPEFEKLIEENSSADYIDGLISRLVNIAIVILFMVPTAKEYKSYRKIAEDFIKKYRKQVLNNPETRLKVKGALALSCIIGFNNLQRLFALIK